MEVALTTQNTPMHFQTPLVEIHWHKNHIWGSVISSTGITYKSSLSLLASNLWPGAVPPSLSFSTPDPPHLSPDPTAACNCCNHIVCLLPTQQSIPQLRVLLSLPNILTLICWQNASYLLRSAKSACDLSPLTPPLKMAGNLLFVLTRPCRG